MFSVYNMAESLDSEASDNLLFNNSESNLGKSSLIDDECNASVSLEGSVVASPSIESFSTLPDGESSLSLADAATDLVVRVDGPQKQADLLETYITFRVSTKTSREEYGATTYSVRRRYNDFVWLRQHLVQTYPTHFVPALPVKHSIIGQFDRYGREFVAARMAALQVFLNRIVKHPILSFARCFKCFLTANCEEFQELRKLTTGSILSKVTDIGKSLSTLHIETHRPREINYFYGYLMDLSEKLNHLCRINQRIRRERTEVVKGLKELKPAIHGWAGVDADLTQELCGVACAVEKTEQGLQNILLDTENFIITQPLREYVLSIDAVKETLDRRDELEVEHIYRREILEKKIFDRGSAQDDTAEASGIRAWVKTFESKEERLERLSHAITISQAALDESKDKLECANANITADMERWAEDKQRDLKSILTSFADQHISHYEQCATSWEDLLVTLKKGVSAS